MKYLTYFAAPSGAFAVLAFQLVLMLSLLSPAVAQVRGGTSGGSGDGGGYTVPVPAFKVDQYTGKARSLQPAPDLTGRTSPIQAVPAPPTPPYPYADEPHVLVATGHNRGTTSAVFKNQLRCITAGAAFVEANPSSRPTYSCTAQ